MSKKKRNAGVKAGSQRKQESNTKAQNQEKERDDTKEKTLEKEEDKKVEKPAKAEVIMAPALTLLLVVVLIIVGTMNIKTDEKNIEDTAKDAAALEITSAPIPTVATKTVSVTPTATPTPGPTATPSPEENEFKKLVPNDVTSLIEEYYAARVISVEEILPYIYDAESITAEQIDENVIMSRVEYVNAYHDIKIHLKTGAGSIDYVAYVENSIEIPSVETYAPSLDELYIKYDEDGAPKIYAGGLSQEENAYMEALRETDDVKELRKKVSNELEKARENDTALDDFFKMMEQYIEQSAEEAKEED